MLVVAWGGVFCIRLNPDLQKSYRINFASIVFAMAHTTSRAHHLHFSGFHGSDRPEAIPMFERTRKHDGYDLHIVVLVKTKTSSARYSIIIKHAECTKIETFRIKIIGKTKGVVGIEPTMIGMTTGSGTMNNMGHKKFR